MKEQKVSETRRHDKKMTTKKQNSQPEIIITNKAEDTTEPTSRAATMLGSECTYCCTSRIIAA